MISCGIQWWRLVLVKSFKIYVSWHSPHWSWFLVYITSVQLKFISWRMINFYMEKWYESQFAYYCFNRSVFHGCTIRLSVLRTSKLTIVSCCTLVVYVALVIGLKYLHPWVAIVKFYCNMSYIDWLEYSLLRIWLSP